MANLYFNAAVDNDWDTLLNWWSDASFTIPSIALPATGDTVYIAADMYTGPSVPVTLNHIYVADASTGGGAFLVRLNVNITSDVTFFDLSGTLGSGQFVGNVIFNDSSYNDIYFAITGAVTFNDSSYNADAAVITGATTFNDSSYNVGIINGATTFNYLSSNSGIVTGNCIFNGSSFNTALASGTATFNDSSYNNAGGLVDYETIFNDSSYNAGDLYDVSTFNNLSYNSGTIYSGGVTFNNSSYNTGGVGTATFNDSSYNTGGVEDGIFNGLYVSTRVQGSYDNSITLNMTCAASGGSDQTIARLLNLPWFINL